MFFVPYVLTRSQANKSLSFWKVHAGMCCIETAIISRPYPAHRLIDFVFALSKKKGST